MISTPVTDLTGKLLIAMPAMQDPRFAQSVVLMCSHSDEGGMGLILNKPASDIRLTDLLKQLSIDVSAEIDRQAIRFGGPVETGRGFVLHSQDFESSVTTLEIEGGFSMTATIDILEEIAAGRGPQERLLMLGYAGWGPGQLESEIAENAWLVADAKADLVFNTDDDEKWSAALATLGIGAAVLSAEGGRA